MHSYNNAAESEIPSLFILHTLRPCQNLVHILPTMQFNYQQFASDIQVCYASNGKL